MQKRANLNIDPLVARKFNKSVTSVAPTKSASDLNGVPSVLKSMFLVPNTWK